MNTCKHDQRGIGFLGIILIVAALVFMATLAMKIVPAYLTNAKIEHIFKEIASDPRMADATVKEVRVSFAKRATMDSITVIAPEDIEVSKEGGSLSLYASYTEKVPVIGNISLVFEFNPHSTK